MFSIPLNGKLGKGAGTSYLPPQEVQQGGGEPGTLVNTGKLATESGNHSSEPLLHLLGCANETGVVVEGVETVALVDTGA